MSLAQPRGTLKKTTEFTNEMNCGNQSPAPVPPQARQEAPRAHGGREALGVNSTASRVWVGPSPRQAHVEPPPLPGTPEAQLKATGWEMPVQRSPRHPGMPTSEPEGDLKSVLDPRGSRRPQQFQHDTQLALSSASPTPPSPCSLPRPGLSSVFFAAAS